ncbi:phospholipase domain-containing protein [Raineyella sp. W15-4]|uniref:phospholipase domain-containing protein n=1 Tax=Raineyella sp. W15-4 TaxID=3081651 RepID=UPI002955B884|nr:phospholipase domain-containing protein [Raineyella sp. W15-4]WOQ17840.1 phospholipase domain-containing protein [Raineyella sp. W15-4]
MPDTHGGGSLNRVAPTHPTPGPQARNPAASPPAPEDTTTGPQPSEYSPGHVGQPHSYTVSAGASLDASWPVNGDYDIQLHGPNGFFRRYAGHGDSTLLAEVAPAGASHQLQLKLSGAAGQQVVVTDAYGAPRRLNGNGALTLDLRASSGWYDVTFSTVDGSWTRTFAGHIENGKPSSSDPQLGR